ncbi:MAG: hypothetical protein LUB56_01315 [Coprobacillus sp.]|nr:hypothetical protein [Coprobacillus sp.]
MNCITRYISSIISEGSPLSKASVLKGIARRLVRDGEEYEMPYALEGGASLDCLVWEESWGNRNKHEAVLAMCNVVLEEEYPSSYEAYEGALKASKEVYDFNRSGTYPVTSFGTFFIAASEESALTLKAMLEGSESVHSLDKIVKCDNGYYLLVFGNYN